MNRTKNSVRNACWGGFQKTVSLIMPFIVRTVLIKVLGGEYLGLNSLFSSVLNLLSLAELGISSAIISTMYKPIAENDTKLICALLYFYRKAYSVIGVIITVIGIFLLPFIPQLISGEVPQDINIYYLYLIYLFNTTISYFLFAYTNCLFIAHQRNDINSKIQTLVYFFQNIIQVFLIIVFKNFYCFVFVIPLCSVITNLSIAFYAKKMFPLYFCKEKLPLDVKKDLYHRVIGLLCGKVSATIRGAVDSLFISMFVGLTAVAIYSNYFYIVSSVVGVLQIIEVSLIASVGNSLVTETVEKNYDDFLKFTFVLQWIVGWCSTCILCLEQPFMQLWLGKEYMLNDSMAYLCAIYLFVVCICLIRSTYTQALGIWWQLRYVSIVDIFVNIFLNYYLGKWYGPYGILAATIIDIMLVSIPWTTYYLFKEYFGKKEYLNYIFLYVKYFVTMIFAGVITLIICLKIELKSCLAELIKNGLICIFVPNIIYLLIFHKNKYFRKIIKNFFFDKA